MSTTWVVVADGTKGVILANQGVGKGLKKVGVFESEEGRKQSREIGSDKPGRAFSRAGEGRAAMEPHTEPQRYAKLEFAHSVAKMLVRMQESFDRLILVAPPKTLGDLRSAMDKQLQGKIIGELDKDLTYLPAHDLPKQLAGIIPI
jgi:protein required for attachment to host cells